MAYESSQAVPSIDPPETADSDETDDLALESGTAPVSTVSFDRSVDLDRQCPAFENGTATANASVQTYTVHVSVRGPGVDLADQGYDEADQRDLH